MAALQLNRLMFASSSASLFGQMSGSLSMVNENDQYGPGDLYKVVSLPLVSTATLPPSVSDPDGIINGARIILGGIINDLSDIDMLDNGTINFKVQSVARRLQKKSINTELYEELASSILVELFTLFGGVPARFVDFSGMGNDFNIYGIVTGNNLWEEATKVAAASRCHLYENNSGIITCVPWKESFTPANAKTIPKQMIMKTTKLISPASSSRVSRVVVRGRFVSNLFAGEQFLTPRKDQKGPEFWKGLTNQGRRTRVVKRGVRAKRTVTRFQQLSGTLCDLQNATLVVNKVKTVGVDESSAASSGGVGNEVEEIVEIPHSEHEIIAALSDENDISLLPGEHEWNHSVKGTSLPREDKEGPTVQHGRLNHLIKDKKNISTNIYGRLTDATPPGVLSDTEDSTHASDERDKQRIEMVIQDNDLVAEFGIITEQIDNRYISDFETLFHTGIRRFQEYKMKRKKWTLECVFMPGLTINDEVTFVTMDNGSTVNGIIESIRYNYKTDKASATMTLDVLDTEDIGATSYTSGNLFFYGDAVGADGSSWIASGIEMHGTFVVFLPGGTLQQILTVEAGAGYTLTATYEGGSGTVSAGAFSATGTGDLTVAVVPPTTSLTVQFSSVSGAYLTAFGIVKTVTR